MKLNDVLQWAGTVCLLTMYVLMNFYRELHPWDSVAGAGGGLCYLIWTIRVANRPQSLVNLAGITVSLAGIYTSWF